MSFFNPDISSPMGSPQSMMDVVIASWLFAFFGVMIFIGAMRYQVNYDKEAKWWKWCFLPLGIATLLGLQKVVFLTDFAYHQTLTRRLFLGHIFALAVPLICIVGIIAFQQIQKRHASRRIYE